MGGTKDLRQLFEKLIYKTGNILGELPLYFFYFKIDFVFLSFIIKS